MTSLAFLEGRRGKIRVRAPEATGIKLLSDIWVFLQIFIVLVGMSPDASRWGSLGIYLSQSMEISVR